MTGMEEHDGLSGDHEGTDAGEAGGDVVEGVVEDEVFAGDGWELVHAARSLAVSGLAGILFLALDFFEPSGPHPERCAAVFASYWLGLSLAAASSRRLLDKREAVLPQDRFGGGRLALVFAALMLGFPGRDAGAELAVWLAAGAVLLGGFADGGWTSLVAARRGSGFWRTWCALVVRERTWRGLCWALLYGSDRAEAPARRSPRSRA